jgi:hypothetical protein
MILQPDQHPGILQAAAAQDLAQLDALTEAQADAGVVQRVCAHLGYLHVLEAQAHVCLTDVVPALRTQGPAIGAAYQEPVVEVGFLHPSDFEPVMQGVAGAAVQQQPACLHWPPFATLWP